MSKMTGKELKGESIVILLEDNIPREVIYDFNALVKLEELTGSLDVLSDLGKFSFINLRALVYAGIYHLYDKMPINERPTIEDIGRLIPYHSDKLTNVSMAITNAIVRDFAGEKKQETEESEEEQKIT